MTAKRFDFDGFMAQMQAVSPGAARFAHELLGCQWGRGIATPDDMAKCDAGAVQDVVLHPPDGSETAVAYLRLCRRHIDRLSQETVPHAEVTA